MSSYQASQIAGLLFMTGCGTIAGWIAMCVAWSRECTVPFSQSCAAQRTRYGFLAFGFLLNAPMYCVLYRFKAADAWKVATSNHSIGWLLGIVIILDLLSIPMAGFTAIRIYLWPSLYAHRKCEWYVLTECKRQGCTTGVGRSATSHYHWPT